MIKVLAPSAAYRLIVPSCLHFAKLGLLQMLSTALDDRLAFGR